MSITENKDVVRRYFEAVNDGDLDVITSLLHEDVTFWVPPSLPDGIEFRGRANVLKLFTESVGLYDPDSGLSVEPRSMTAEADRVAVELVIRGRSAASGEPYENWYHFLFRLQGGTIVAIREHLDSLYAFRTLFVPAGITERRHCKWLP